MYNGNATKQLGNIQTKQDKCKTIVNAVEDNGWKVVPLCVEVGARGHMN